MNGSLATRLDALSVLIAQLSALDGAFIGDEPETADASLLAQTLPILTSAGALSAMLPPEAGGLGLCDVGGERELAHVLRLCGRVNLALGRCVEGHANVARLVLAYGSPGQRDRLARCAAEGVLAGVWVTDGASPVTCEPGARGLVLRGGKGFCSAVHSVRLALITARRPDRQTVMALVDIDDPARIGRGPGKLTGMMQSDTGAYDMSGLILSPEDIVGSPGDYLRQPEFSAGAWRACAVALGAMDTLVDLLRGELVARGRAGDPHQAVRIGEALIARETAAMWVDRAASATADPALAPQDVTGIVNLARIAVEQAALSLVTLVQRGLGLAAFIRGRRVERVMRDLATYLRQPAPDEALTEAARWFADRPWPGADL